MSGGWAGSDRRSRLPSDWPTIVATVHQRSGNRCEVLINAKRGGRFRCPNKADGGVDHIIPDDNDDLSNLQDTCSRHHRAKSAAEGVAAKAAIRARGRREPGPHPGLIRRPS